MNKKIKIKEWIKDESFVLLKYKKLLKDSKINIKEIFTQI